jgi:hypothetical protein
MLNADTEYFLNVDLIVKAENADAFEESMTEFLNKDGFTRIVQEGDDDSLRTGATDKKRLILALKEQEELKYAHGISLPGRHRREGELSAIRYIHLWSMPQLKDLDLVRLMRLCAADGLYQRIDSLVLEESQNFIVRIPFPEANASKSFFIRHMNRFTSSGLGTYMFDVGVAMPLVQSSLTSLGMYQVVTGHINSTVEFWNSGDAKISSMKDVLQQKQFEQEFQKRFLDPLQSEPAASAVSICRPYLEESKLGPAERCGQISRLKSILN